LLKLWPHLAQLAAMRVCALHSRSMHPAQDCNCQSCCGRQLRDLNLKGADDCAADQWSAFTASDLQEDHLLETSTSSSSSRPSLSEEGCSGEQAKDDTDDLASTAAEPSTSSLSPSPSGHSRHPDIADDPFSELSESAARRRRFDEVLPEADFDVYDPRKPEFVAPASPGEVDRARTQLVLQQAAQLEARSQRAPWRIRRHYRRVIRDMEVEVPQLSTRKPSRAAWTSLGLAPFFLGASAVIALLLCKNDFGGTLSRSAWLCRFGSLAGQALWKVVTAGVASKALRD